MDSLIQIAVFFAQTLIIIVGIIAVILTIAAVSIKGKTDKHPEINDLNEKYENQRQGLLSVVLSEDEFKKEKKKIKAAEKSKGPHVSDRKKLYVIDFLKGDVQASSVDRFREEITSVLAVAKTTDEVLINVESPGGVVHGYGLAAAQILRLRTAGLKVTVSVDKVAASGGYLMACVAQNIIASPFAIIGSIGVVAQVPNFYRLLKKNDVDYREYTAGDFKRTVSLFGEITEKGEKKFIEQLESTHDLFKKFVSQFRPHLKLEETATGEYWFGEHALTKGLVDKIQTSDDFVQYALSSHHVLKVSFEKKPSLSQKISELVLACTDKVLGSLLHNRFHSLAQANSEISQTFNLGKNEFPLSQEMNKNSFDHLR